MGIRKKKVHPKPPLSEGVAGKRIRKTKFYRFMIDLQRLAQFDPEHEFSANNSFVEFLLDNVEDAMLPLADVDSLLYWRFEFTPAMINFVEARYSYDELHD